MFNTLAVELVATMSLTSGGGDKEQSPPPWFHSWDQLESRIKNIDPAEPSVLCVTVRATDRVFWTSLAGVARKNLEFTLLSSEQFEKVNGKWTLVEEIDIQFRISKRLPFPMDLDNGSIEVDAEHLVIVIRPYGTVILPGYPR